MRIFLGSSTETLSVLDRVGRWLESAGHTPLYWNAPDLFLPGDNTFLRLIDISRQVQAAIFVFAEDDHVWYRANALSQPRDNVLLEYGLFAGTLGQRRVAICRYGRPKGPSDLHGVITLDVPESRHSAARRKLNAWLKKLDSPDPTSDGPDISGIWLSYDSADPAANPAGRAQISQKGTSVTMSLHRLRARDGGPTDRTFQYRGSFSSGQLTLLFEDERARGFITGAIVLRMSSTLDTLTQ